MLRLFVLRETQLNVNNMCHHIFHRGQGETISVKEARKLLGASHNELSDETMMGVIHYMVNLSEELLRWQNSSTKLEGGV